MKKKYFYYISLSIIILFLALEIFSLTGCLLKKKYPLHKVALIGLDAANWNAMQPMIKRGMLPALKAIRQHGVYGNLTTFIPTVSPAIWTTIVTGKVIAKHGIIYRLIKLQGEQSQDNLLSLTSSERKCLALWNILDKFNLSSTVVNWWASWPAEKINGYIVTDRTYIDLLQNRTFPENLLDEMQEHNIKPSPPLELEAELQLLQSEISRLAEVSNFEQAIKVQDQVALPVSEWIKRLHALMKFAWLDNWSRKTTEYIVKNKGQTNFLACYMWGPDMVQHLFFKDYMPELFELPEGELPLFSKVVENYYQFMDSSVDNLITLLDPLTNIILVSDHGMQPSFEEQFIDQHFQLDKLLKLMNLAEEISFDPNGNILTNGKIYIKDSYDTLRTINLNKKNREVHGVINADEANQFLVELAEKLNNLQTVQDKPLFEKVEVLNSEQDSFFVNKHKVFLLEDTDLYCFLNRNVRKDDFIKINNKIYPITEFDSKKPARSGAHPEAPDGMIIAVGPDIYQGKIIEDARVFDITPTILALLDLPIGEDMDGETLENVVQRSFLIAHPPRYVPTLEPAPKELEAKPVISVDPKRGDKEVIEALQALGYIE